MKINLAAGIRAYAAGQTPAEIAAAAATPDPKPVKAASPAPAYAQPVGMLDRLKAWWTNLPTWGKVGVGVGAPGGLLLLLWLLVGKRKGK